MAGERYMTTEHDRIREWVEDRNGKPSTVKSTHSDDDPGLIRLDFPGYSGGTRSRRSRGTSGSRSSTTATWSSSTRRPSPTVERATSTSSSAATRPKRTTVPNGSVGRRAEGLQGRAQARVRRAARAAGTAAST